MMRLLDGLEESEILNCNEILIDTRAFRCYLNVEQMDTIFLEAGKKVNENSLIDQEEILSTLRKIKSLIGEHAIFDFIGAVETKRFWPLKYIYLLRIDKKRFQFITNYGDQINWREMLKPENLIIRA